MPRDSLALDDLDHDLLGLLQADAGRTLRELGEIVGLSPSAVLRRVERYKRGGLLARKVAVLDSRHAPDVVLAVVLVTVERDTQEHHEEFSQRLRATAEVQQAYGVSGDWDYMVVMAAVGMPRMSEVIGRLFQDDPNVRKFTTLFVFYPVKTGCAVPTRP